ncbi:MAG: Gfo/Idh/MocA family protein [Acidimicrobiales bacterium]
MATLRWGIIGTGSIARAFARDLALVAGGDVVAVGSRTPDGAAAFVREFGAVRAHASYEALVADPGVDVVYVATPHPFHHDNARLALAAGKPVLVEKPFTMTAVEARDLVDLARASRLFLMEAMWTRFLPHVVAIREILERGELGEIVGVEADHGQWFDADPTSRLFAPDLGGGALLDLGVYPVSFASMVLGAPSRVSALVTAASTGVDAQTSMLFGYDGGAQAVLTCTSRARSATRASIVGTEARLDVEGDFYAPSSFDVVTRDGARTRHDFDTRGRGLHYEAAEVTRCVLEGRLESPVMPLDESVSVVATLERVLASSALPAPRASGS